MTNRCTTAQSTEVVRRWAPPAIVTLAATAALTALTAAPPAGAAPRQAPPEQTTEGAAPRRAGEPIMAIVSIKSQHVTIYDSEGWILRAPVSSGTKGRETPAGVFSVLQKDKDHHSNLYDDAWMPNMLRITWSGIALHGGPLPGYAASHGCVRMPFGFAEKLFDKVRIGTRVIISPGDAEPVEFSHPALFVPKSEAIAAAPARAETLAREADEATKRAPETRKAAPAGGAGGARRAREPVWAFISRATQRLYVRRNTHKRLPDGGEVFDATIEVPVTIRNPDKPIGTHVFTAVARNDAGLRWTAVTIDNGDDAKNALDRITIPQDVLDRIAPTALPRSSIVISDEPLSGETNYRTEFVAVLNNQPQGGFVTRRPTADIAVASGNFWGDDGLGSLFQPNWNPQTGITRRRGGQYYYQVQRGWW